MKKVLLLILLVPIVVWSSPGPGDVFKEFTYVPLQDHFAELDPNCPRKADPNFDMRNWQHQVTKKLNIELGDAIRAEMSVEYWGGHIGTSEQKFRVNGHDWIYIPQPHNTSGSPQCYYRTILGNETVPIPLEYLKDGCNEFQFTCGPQICHNFNWGFYWIYSFTVYIYYNSLKPHTEGKITSPVSGSTTGDSPRITLSPSSPPGSIKQVDFIGYYEDFDWDGNGIFRQWQYQTQYGSLRKHLGTTTCAPYTVTWDTEWIQDQDQPIKIMAKITNNNGVCYMTPAVENISLVRKDRSVKMYKASEVPENFGVRVGKKKTCKINITDNLSNAKDARLLLSTWSAAHSDEIGINDKMIVERIGRVHDYSYDSIRVPLDIIKKGTNIFYIFSKTEHHALEVNWPGPVLLIKYEATKQPSIQETEKQRCKWNLTMLLV